MIEKLVSSLSWKFWAFPFSKVSDVDFWKWQCLLIQNEDLKSVGFWFLRNFIFKIFALEISFKILYQVIISDFLLWIIFFHLRKWEKIDSLSIFFSSGYQFLFWMSFLHWGSRPFSGFWFNKNLTIKF